jgi:hypothetical protein
VFREEESPLPDSIPPAVERLPASSQPASTDDNVSVEGEKTSS